MSEYVDGLHDMHTKGVRYTETKKWSAQVVNFYTCREIWKFYTSTNRVCKKYCGVQSQGYRILSRFLAMAVRLVHVSTNTIDCHTKWKFQCDTAVDNSASAVHSNTYRSLQQ